jgi:hypothetical protein
MAIIRPATVSKVIGTTVILSPLYRKLADCSFSLGGAVFGVRVPLASGYVVTAVVRLECFRH